MKLHELLLPTFRDTVQTVTHTCGKRTPSKKIFKFSFLYFSSVILSFHSFASTMKTEAASENTPCLQPFQQYIPPLNPVNPNNLTIIRNRLETKHGIEGSVTLNMEQPFNPAMAERLRKFLIIKMRTLYDAHFPYPFEYTLSESGFFPPEEIIEMRHGLNRYFEQIKQIILQVDGRSVKLSNLEIRTENAPALNHRHKFQKSFQRWYWISVTYALIGSGSWYETIHNNEKQTAVVKTGETLFLSEPYRMHALSGTPETVLDAYMSKPDGYHQLPNGQPFIPFEGASHGSSSGKRLIIVAIFELQSDPRDLKK